MKNFLLTTDVVAQHLGVTAIRVEQLCRAGRLPAHKLGRDWVIKSSDLAAFVPRGPGRPKGRKTRKK